MDNISILSEYFNLDEYPNILNNVDMLLEHLDPDFVSLYKNNIEKLFDVEGFKLLFSKSTIAPTLEKILMNERDYIFFDFDIYSLLANIPFLYKISEFKDFDCYEKIMEYLNTQNNNRKDKLLDYFISIKEYTTNTRYVSLFVELYILNNKYRKQLERILISENKYIIDAGGFTSQIYPSIPDSKFKESVYALLRPSEKDMTFIGTYGMGIGSIKEKVMEINRLDPMYKPYQGYLDIFYFFDYSNESFEKLYNLMKLEDLKKFVNIIFKEK